MNWKHDKPPTCGYYLAAWVAPSGRSTVSELWFNPTTGWWAVREYIPTECRTSVGRTQVPYEVAGVYAWAEKPEAPLIDDERHKVEKGRWLHRMCIYRHGGDRCPCHCVEQHEARKALEEAERKARGGIL